MSDDLILKKLKKISNRKIDITLCRKICDTVRYH